MERETDKQTEGKERLADKENLGHACTQIDKLTKRQNNILKENFLEFYEESLQIYTDQTFLFFAMQNLIKKNIPTFLIYGSKDMAFWPEWGGGEGPEKIKFHNDKDPQFMYKLFNCYACISKGNWYNCGGKAKK